MTADETRSEDEIRADLATEEGRGALERQSPTGRLVADVPALLADRSRLEQENGQLRAALAADGGPAGGALTVWLRNADALIAAREEVTRLRQAVEAVPEAAWRHEIERSASVADPQGYMEVVAGVVSRVRDSLAAALGGVSPEGSQPTERRSDDE